MTNRFTENDKTQFKVWLVKNNLSLRQFAKVCGVSYAYISSAICGKISITESVKQTFLKGGYVIK